MTSFKKTVSVTSVTIALSGCSILMEPDPVRESSGTGGQASVGGVGGGAWGGTGIGNAGVFGIGGGLGSAGGGAGSGAGGMGGSAGVPWTSAGVPAGGVSRESGGAPPATGSSGTSGALQDLGSAGGRFSAGGVANTGGTTSAAGSVASLGGSAGKAGGAGLAGYAGAAVDPACPVKVPDAVGSFTVTNGYARLGSLHGYLETIVSADSVGFTCVRPECQDIGCATKVGSSALCIAGILPPLGKGKIAMFWALNQTVDGQFGNVTIPSAIQLKFDPGGKSPDIGVNLVDSSWNQYCAMSGLQLPILLFTLDQFYRDCSPYAEHPTSSTEIFGIMVIFVNNSSVESPVSLCLTGVRID